MSRLAGTRPWNATRLAPRSTGPSSGFAGGKTKDGSPAVCMMRTDATLRCSCGRVLITWTGPYMWMKERVPEPEQK